MRIVVAIKQILNPAGVVVNLRREMIFVNREEYILGPADKCALEVALQWKEAVGAEVVAVSLGPARADDALREALAMGADAAYHLADPAFDQADIAVATRALAAAIRRLEPVDLVLVGDRSGDTGSGQVGPRLAEALGLAQVTGAVRVRPADGAAEVVRRWQGQFAKVRVPLPALVAVAAGSVKPRYPHGARIMNAYRQWQVARWSAADLGLAEDLRPLVVYRGQAFPPAPEVGEMVRGEPAEAARELWNILKTQKLV
ncbi:MAG: electron transfer flavoprotein subunit beta/FixA family protein [Anaerolineae bacterium]